MVNYAKWDKFGVELDSSDDENGHPIVTKFDNPRTVMLGEKSLDCEVEKKRSGPTAIESKAKMLENGSWVCRDGMTYGWGQDKDSLFLYIHVDQQTKSTQIGVDLKETELAVCLPPPNKLRTFKFDFPYEICIDEETWLWEFYRGSLDVNGEKKNGTWLYITMKKKQIIADAFVYWPCMSKDDPKRKDIKPSAGKFLEVWNQAHELFLSKRQHDQRISLDEPIDDPIKL